MKFQSTRALLSAATLALILTPAATARAAKVLVLANNGDASVAAEFTAKTVGHVYTAFNANVTPTLDQLNQHDAVLLFENGHFGNAKNVGDAVAAYYNQGGKCVVIGTFYWQDRTGNPNYPGQPGWGALEAVDVFLATPGGSEYAPDSLDPNSIVPHPITANLKALSASSYRGGVEAKPGTTVLAKWLTPNKLNTADPLIGIREDPNGGKFVGISVFPDYEGVGNYGVDFNGDFYPLWQDAFTWCASPCGNGMVQPARSATTATP